MSTLTAIQKQLLEMDGIIARLRTSARTSARPSVFAQIKSLEKEQRRLRSEFEFAATKEELDVCHYAIEYPDRPTMAGLSDAWKGFQNVLGDVYKLMKSGPPKKRKGKVIEQDVIEVPQLSWGFEFGGSLGVAMTLPSQHGLFGDPILNTAMNAVFNIAKTSEDDDPRKLSSEYGPHVVSAVHRWAETHARYGYGVKVDWFPRNSIVNSLTLRPSEVVSLRDRLAKTTIESRLELSGQLVRVDFESKQCKLNADDGREIIATYDTAITEEHAANVPARYSAVFNEITPVVVPDDKDPEPTYFLVVLTNPAG